MIALSDLLLAVVLFSAIFASMASFAQSKTFYRYINNSGFQVISDSIPPQYAAQGYDIIDSKGIIVEKVLPELSVEEKRRIRLEKEAEEKMALWDSELLSRYSTVEDIKATKKRRITGINNSIYSLQLTLNNISNTIKLYQAEAAANERQGEEVPEETLFSITRLQKDRLFFEDEIERKQSHKQQTNDNYDKDIERFMIIKPANKRFTAP